MALFGDFTSGVGMPTGYSGLTPDQAAMVQQQGYFMRPDAVMPNGGQFQQPAGYSNLTPDQIQAVNSQGYYNQPGVSQPSLWDKVTNALGGQSGQDAIKKLQDAMAGPQPVPHAPFTQPLTPYHAMAPRNIYNARQYSPLDPKLALQALQRGT